MILDFSGLASYIFIVFLLHFILKIIYDFLILDINTIRKIEWAIDCIVLVLIFTTFIFFGILFRQLNQDILILKISLGIILLGVPIFFSILKYHLYRKYGIQGNGYSEILINTGYWLFLIILSILVTSHL